MLLVRCSYLWGSTNISLTFKNLTGRGPDGKKNPGDRTFHAGKSAKYYRRKRKVTFKKCLGKPAAVAFAQQQSKLPQASQVWMYYRLLENGLVVPREEGSVLPKNDQHGTCYFKEDWTQIPHGDMGPNGKISTRSESSSAGQERQRIVAYKRGWIEKAANTRKHRRLDKENPDS